MAIRQNMPIWWIVILAIYIGTCLVTSTTLIPLAVASTEYASSGAVHRFVLFMVELSVMNYIGWMCNENDIQAKCNGLSLLACLTHS